MNFLEELLFEYYEFKGYHVKKNIKVAKREKGGYAGEIDIAAYSFKRNHLLQIEPSMDAQNWVDRENRYRKKFEVGKDHILDLFEMPPNSTPNIEQIAMFLPRKDRTDRTFCGGRIVFIDEFLKEVHREISEKNLMKSAVPESYPLLRMMQFMNEYAKIEFLNG